jgi:hypothetical protein
MACKAFVRDVREVKAFQVAELVRPLGRYSFDRPVELFQVKFQGRTILVERRDIEEI